MNIRLSKDEVVFLFEFLKSFQNSLGVVVMTLKEPSLGVALKKMENKFKKALEKAK